MSRRRKTLDQLPDPKTEASIQKWLIEQVAIRLGVAPDEINPERSFEANGLDSRAAIQFSGALEKATKLDLAPSLLYDYETINELSRYLATEFDLTNGSRPL
jgi:acyl carrier protein